MSSTDDSTATLLGATNRATAPPLELHDVLLLDSTAKEPIPIAVLTFGDDGIGVTRSAGEQARVLPWTAVEMHLIEGWGGGVIPEWWVDPELNQGRTSSQRPGAILDPDATSRILPSAEAGAMISVRTSTGLFRFLLPKGDPRAISRRVDYFSVRHRGPDQVSAATTVVSRSGAHALAGHGVRGARRAGDPSPTWARVRPWLIVALILVLLVGAVIILLQSAGRIHLPWLGGTSPSALQPLHAATAARHGA